MPPLKRARSLFEKIWDKHRIRSLPDGRDLLFVDRHIVQETTCAPAFENLERANRAVLRPDLTFAVQDHIVSTAPERTEHSNPEGRELMQALRRNAARHGIRHYGIDHPRQGIVHVIGPELGIALPGTLLDCGDSHTATVGGIGALGIGVGTSEAEHVLAAQTLALPRPRPMRIRFDGALGSGMTAKDLVLFTIGRLGIAAGAGHAIEYAGPVIRGMPVEGRLTICNMSIELGARLGIIAPDEATFAYLAGRPFAPRGRHWEDAVATWRTLASDADAVFDGEFRLDCTSAAPQVTWGTTQDQVIGVDETVPDPDTIADRERRRLAAAALAYMDLRPGTLMDGVPIDMAFIGSCTNGRLSDLRAAAAVVRGRRVAPGVRALVVPGSSSVRREAAAEGLDRVFLDAGFEWRNAGCSMCVSINQDVVPPGARCIATSNRNFENRQGPGSRTHLASPAMVAAAAIAGTIVDIRRMPA